MADLTLAGFNVLRAVAERGSFTAAADALGYTQSAVSRQVAGLEAAAGAPLFERAARGVRLTEAGRVLLRHAGEVLDRVDSARREITGMRDLATRRVRVGAFPTAMAALIPRAIAAARSQEAGIDIALREGTTASQLRRLASGGIDLAVVGTPPGEPGDGPGLAFDALLDDPLLLAVGRSHRLARRRTVHLDDLAGEHWIAASMNPSETFLRVWDALEWEPKVEFVAREWTAKLGLVAAGLGVTLVPGLAATAVRDDVSLVRVRSDRPASRTVVLATRAGTELPPHARAFADVLHPIAAELTVEVQRRIHDS